MAIRLETEKLLETLIEAASLGRNLEVELDPRVQTTSHRQLMPRLLRVQLGIDSSHITIRGNRTPFGGTMLFRGSLRPLVCGRYTSRETVAKGIKLASDYDILLGPTLVELKEALENCKLGVILHANTISENDLQSYDPLTQRDGSILILK